MSNKISDRVRHCGKVAFKSMLFYWVLAEYKKTKNTVPQFVFNISEHKNNEQSYEIYNDFIILSVYMYTFVK